MLLDHFHPPLSTRRHGESFHHQWACNVAADLNRRLPPKWFAEATIRFGIEIDVGVEDESPTRAEVGVESEAALEFAAPPQPVMTIDFPFTTDVVEVRVFSHEDGPTLAGSIEFVSPANKDRPGSRDAFVGKCIGYLQDAVGLVIVDIVTERHANLHRELMNRFEHARPEWRDNSLYISAYGPTANGDHSQLELWFEPVAIQGAIPSMPLFLKSGPRVVVDLAGTYVAACKDLRIPLATNEHDS